MSKVTSADCKNLLELKTKMSGWKRTAKTNGTGGVVLRAFENDTHIANVLESMGQLTVFGLMRQHASVGPSSFSPPQFNKGDHAFFYDWIDDEIGEGKIDSVYMSDGVRTYQFYDGRSEEGFVFSTKTEVQTAVDNAKKNDQIYLWAVSFNGDTAFDHLKYDAPTQEDFDREEASGEMFGVARIIATPKSYFDKTGHWLDTGTLPLWPAEFITKTLGLDEASEFDFGCPLTDLVDVLAKLRANPNYIEVNDPNKDEEE